MSPGATAGGEPSAVARRAAERGETVVAVGEATTVGYEDAETSVVDAAAVGENGVTIAAPSVAETDTGDVGVILVVRWTELERVAEHHVRPLGYLADHVATAIGNIRSRERLERARNDLARRKEMIEVYDRLLRHDLGNDLQVITGFSNALVEAVEEGSQAAEYAEKIDRTAASAADLIGRVGDLVQTLEQEEEPEPRRLRPILVDVVESVDAKFDSLTVEFDPETVEGRVYAGDLLDSIFTNVLSNAAVHNDDPVTVAVDTEEPTPESVTVVFADDGAGVAESVREDIFEMGKKGPDSDGTGFGLGLARALTESYGGTVALSDSDAGGAEFRVTLERA
jgi:signal transduction histidine kinase